MKVPESTMCLFIHVKFCSLGNPTETHLVFLSNPKENTHSSLYFSTHYEPYNMENNEKTKKDLHKYGMITVKTSR